jgi:hypothetical protein
MMLANPSRPYVVRVGGCGLSDYTLQSNRSKLIRSNSRYGAKRRTDAAPSYWAEIPMARRCQPVRRKQSSIDTAPGNSPIILSEMQALSS